MKTLDRSSVAMMLENFASLVLAQNEDSKLTCESACKLANQLLDVAEDVRFGLTALGSGIESYAFCRMYMTFCDTWVRRTQSRQEALQLVFQWSHKKWERGMRHPFKKIPLQALYSLVKMLDELGEDVIWRQLFDSSVSKLEV